MNYAFQDFFHAYLNFQGLSGYLSKRVGNAGAVNKCKIHSSGWQVSLLLSACVSAPERLFLVTL
jgi:hypothetical protein